MIVKSLCETEKIAKKLASKLKGNEVIALYGDLGVGKTAFTRALASFFGLEDEVSSPTFSLVNEYSNEKIRICHFDMYRISGFEDLESTGFFDYIGNAVLVIEWSENVDKYLPENTIKIRFSRYGENARIIDVEGVDLSESFGS